MPANLTPNYLAAEARFRAAQTDEEKLAGLEEMYATIPKHKGTERLRADIKRRMSKLRERRKSERNADAFNIVKQGAGQVVLLGSPNSGKSSLVGLLAPSAMMEYEDIEIQLVDVPLEEGAASLIQNADAVALVLDCSDDLLLEVIEDIRLELSNYSTVLVGKGSEDRDLAAHLLAKPTIIVANKIELPGSDENLAVLREIYGDEFVIEPVSEGLDKLRLALFNSLGIIRVYTKGSDKPFIMKKGSRLIDFASAVYKDCAGQIDRYRVLEDRDVVDLYR